MSDVGVRVDATDRHYWAKELVRLICEKTCAAGQRRKVGSRGQERTLVFQGFLDCPKMEPTWVFFGLLVEYFLEEDDAFSPRIKWETYHRDDQITRHRWAVEFWCFAGDATYGVGTYGYGRGDLPLAVSLAAALFLDLDIPDEIMACFEPELDTKLTNSLLKYRKKMGEIYDKDSL